MLLFVNQGHVFVNIVLTFIAPGLFRVGVVFSSLSFPQAPMRVVYTCVGSA